MGEETPIVLRPCCVCGEEVPYQKDRRKCRLCHRWCHHGSCSMDTHADRASGPPATCHLCLRERPGTYFIDEAVELIGGKRFKDDESVPATAFVIWCLVFGRDAGRETTEKLGFPAESVAEWDAALEKGGCWVRGKLALEEQMWESPGAFNVGLILYSLLATGHVERQWTPDPEPAAPAAEVAPSAPYEDPETTEHDDEKSSEEDDSGR